MFDKIDLWIIEKSLLLLNRLFPAIATHKKTSIAWMVNFTFWYAGGATVVWIIDGLIIAQYLIGIVWTVFVGLTVKKCIED